MPELQDFLSAQALVPCGLTVLASAMSVHGLYAPELGVARKRLCLGYAIAAAFLTAGLLYFGSSQHQDSRAADDRVQRLDKNIDTIRAVLGSDPHMSGEEVLQHIIDKFNVPWTLSGAQAAKLANEVAFLKSALPQTITLARLYSDSSGFNVWDTSQSVLSRNGLQVTSPNMLPVSTQEVGIMFVVTDPAQPPPVVLKLVNIIELVGSTAKVVKADGRVLGDGGFTIFVGPKPLG